MMTEKQIRSYRDDLRACLAKARACQCFVCQITYAACASQMQAQIKAFGIVLGDENADNEIEAAAAMARR